MKEKLQEYALIAEIIGGISIVLSLVFVGFQLKQGNDLAELNLRSLERQQSLEWADARQRIFIDSPELLAIHAKLEGKNQDGTNPTVDELVDTFNFTKEEAILWWRFFRYIWEREEADWRFYQSSRERCRESAVYLRFLDHQIFWKNMKRSFDINFVTCVENEAHSIYPEITF